jgi:tRNA(Ile)-lysidine synthase
MTQAADDAGPVTAEEARTWFTMLADAAGLLLAVSGGADSTALLVLAAEWAAGTGARLVAGTVDHGLRPEGAEEAADVAGLAARLGVPHVTLRWTGAKPGTGIEQAARRARYALLTELAGKEGLSHLVTAHTIDDQAETVLMRLAAGSGLSGLAAMREITAREGLLHARPLLGVAKARLVATLRAKGVAWSEDAMNADPAFARPRLRAARVVLEREGLSNERLALLSRRVARAEEVLERATDTAWAQFTVPTDRGVRIGGEGLADLPAEIALRLLLRAIDLNGDGTPRRLARAEALCDAVFAALAEGRAVVRTLAGARVSVRGGGISVAPAPPRRARRLQTTA